MGGARPEGGFGSSGRLVRMALPDEGNSAGMIQDYLVNSH